MKGSMDEGRGRGRRWRRWRSIFMYLQPGVYLLRETQNSPWRCLAPGLNSEVTKIMITRKSSLILIADQDT